MKAYFERFIVWIDLQIFWLKSLFSEVLPDKTLKFSHKRLAILGLIYSFILTYVRGSWDIVSKSDKTGQVLIPDIPWGWAFFIAGLLGLGIYSNMQNNKNNKPENNGDDSQS